jgi:thiol:disulfide interchange protein DsbD
MHGPRLALLAAVLLLIPFLGQAQPGPDGSAGKVDWTAVGDTLAPGENGAVILRASIADGWKMYAPESPPPTRGVEVTIDSAATAPIRTGPVRQSEPQRGHDPNFDLTVQFYEGDASLRIPVRLAQPDAAGAHPVRGTVTFMVCTDELCLPPATTAFEAVVVVRTDG